MKYGYIRKSPNNVDEKIQYQELLNYGISENNIICDTNTTENLEILISRLCVNDTLVVFNTLCLGKHGQALPKLIFKLENLNINFVTIQEEFNTGTEQGKYVLLMWKRLIKTEQEIEAEKKYLLSLKKNSQKNKTKRQRKKDAAITMYIGGSKIDDILRTIDITKPTLYKFLKEENISITRQKHPDKDKIEKEIVELYKQGMSAQKLAGEFGVSRNTVYNYVKKATSVRNK